MRERARHLVYKTLHACDSEGHSCHSGRTREITGFPPKCLQTELELLRISRHNVCHRSGDFEPDIRGNHAMAESAEPMYDAEAASKSVHLVAENRVIRLASRPVSTGNPERPPAPP